MTRYHFNAEDGRLYPDNDGVELPDFRAAMHKATTFLAELLREQPELFWKHQSLRVNVTDDSGLTLFSLDLTAIMAPVSTGTPRDGLIQP